jgi:hypothetical protein
MLGMRETFRALHQEVFGTENQPTQTPSNDTPTSGRQPPVTALDQLKSQFWDRSHR